MKKFMLLFVILTLSVAAYSQKGKITLGLDYHKMNNPYVYSYDLYPYGYYGPTYSFEPRVGWFITDNIEVGLGFKVGDDELEHNYNSTNPSGNGDDFSYAAISSTSYKTFSPYLKYYKDGFFFSVRFSLNSYSSAYNSLHPFWEADTNGIYNVVGFDKYSSETFSFIKTTAFNIGYVLSYNDKIFFEPSFGIKTNYGETENLYVIDYYIDNIVEQQNPVVSPIVNSSHFSVNLSVSLRLGK